MPAQDTTEEAEAVRRQALAALTGARRAELALELGDELLAVAKAGIRARRPDLDDAGVLAQLHRLLGHHESNGSRSSG